MIYPFPYDFAAATTNFLEAAGAAKAQIRGYPLHEYFGHDGLPLATYVASLGPRNAAKVLVVSAGTHGSENASGSIIQTDLLVAAQRGELPQNIRIVLAHGVNPFGAEHMMREFPVRLSDGRMAFIDFNRHCHDFTKPLPETPEFLTRPLDAWPDIALETRQRYANVTELLVPKFSNRDDIIAVHEAIRVLSENEGNAKALLTNVMRGQFMFPHGLHFTGTEPSWIYGAWNAVETEILMQEPERIVHLDFHTGLGDRGARTMFALTQEGSPVDREAQEMFPGMDIKCLHPANAINQAVSVVVTGPMAGHWPLASAAIGLRPPTIIPVGIEFGTTPMLPSPNLAAADIFTHPYNLLTVGTRLALRAYYQDHHPLSDLIKGMMRDVFSPNDPQWHRAVRDGGHNLVHRALAHLGR